MVTWLRGLHDYAGYGQGCMTCMIYNKVPLYKLLGFYGYKACIWIGHWPGCWTCMSCLTWHITDLLHFNDILKLLWAYDIYTCCIHLKITKIYVPCHCHPLHSHTPPPPTEKCHLSLAPVGIAWVVPKHSPFTMILSFSPIFHCIDSYEVWARITRIAIKISVLYCL